MRAPRHNNTGKGFHHNAANNTSNGGFNYRSDQSSRPSTASQSSYAQSSNNPSFRHQERSRQLAGYDDRRDTRGDYGDKPMAHRAEYRGAPPPAPYLEKPHIRQVDPYSREPEYAQGDYDYRSTIDPYARPPQSRRGGERGPPPPPPAYDRYPSYDSRDDSRSPPPPHYPPHGLPQHPPHHVPLHHVAPHHPPPHHAPPHLGSNKRSYEDHHDFVGYSAPPPRGPPPGPRGPPMGHFPRGPPPSYDDHHIPQPRYDQRPPHPQFQSYPGPRGPPPPPPMHMGHEWNDRGGYRPPRDGPDPFPPRPRYDDRAVPPPPRGYDRGDYRPSPVDDYQTKRARY